MFPAANAKSLVNPLRRLVQSPRRTVATMELHGNESVLEVGAGPGFFSSSLLEALPRGRLVILDLQAEMVGLARDRLLGHPNVGFVQGDATSLPLASQHFDAVLLATMLGEVPDADACLDEVCRVLRPGGAVTVAETRRDSDFIPLPALRALMDCHGLTLSIRRGIAWQYVARFHASR